MAVAFRAATDDARGTTTPVSVPAPAGVVAGDLLIAIQTSDLNGSLAAMSAPAGFVEVGSGSRTDTGFLKVWRKTATSSEPATYDFVDSTSAHGSGIVVAVTGQDTSTPLAVVPVFANGAASTSHVAPSVTGVTDGLLITAYLAGTSGTTRDYTAPAGMTTAQKSALTTGGNILTGAYYQALTVDGATGTRTATPSASTPWVAMSLVVAPLATNQSLTGVGIPSGEAHGLGVVTLPAKRLYLTNAAATFTPATIRGAWDNTAQAVVRKLGDGAEGANTSVNAVDTSTTNAWDVLAGRWVSEPAFASGTLSGTASWVFGAQESDTADNMFGHLHVYVTVGSTDVVRGTLVANDISTTEFGTTAAGRGDTSVPITTVAVQAGDRLVVELGYQANNTTLTNSSGVNRNATVWYGGTGTDLTVNGTAVTTAPGWFEVSGGTVVFGTPPDQTLTGVSINSAEAFGVGTVNVAAAPIDITGVGIASGEAHGVGLLSIAAVPGQIGLYPSESLFPSESLYPSDAAVSTQKDLLGVGIDSGEAFGVGLIQLANGPQDLFGTGIDSLESFGVGTIAVFVGPQDITGTDGIPTGETFGIGTIAVAVPPPPPFGLDYDLDTYYIDGIDLTTYAVRIETAEGLQLTPGVLGDDVMLPGRDGAIEVFGGIGQQRRPDAPGKIVFNLWLKGVDPQTGRVPGGKTSAEEYFARWDELVRILHRRRVTIDHPRPDGTRRAIAHLNPGESIGPARTPSSPWFGRFRATFVIPAAHWLDVDPVTTGVQTVTTGGAINLGAFAAATAPCTELRVVFGSGNNPRLNTSTGHLGWNGVIAAGRQLGIDTATGTTDQASGAIWQPGYSELTFAPGPRLFEIDPSEPLAATLTHTGGGTMSVEISGKRRYRTS